MRKTRGGLRSTTVVAGGFMPLRAGGENAAASLRQPLLVASDATGQSDSLLRHLCGEAVRTLSPTAKRRLLSIALGEGRQRSLGIRANSTAITLFLALNLPPTRLVTTAPDYGIGVVSRNGSSLAVIEPTFARPNSTTSSIRAFGGTEAEELLLRYVHDWDRRGRPSESELQITVTYTETGSRLRLRWPRPR